MAENSHLDHVRRLLTQQEHIPIDYIALAPVSRDTSRLGRLKHYIGLCQDVFSRADRLKDRRIVFASITAPILTAVKLCLLLHREAKCLVVPHAVLESVGVRSSHGWPSWFHMAFAKGNSVRLRYLILGESIRRNLAINAPEVSNLITIDHPYFFAPPVEFSPFRNQTIRFGSLGVGHRGKGTDILLRIAQEFATREFRYKPEFWLIGSVVDDTIDVQSTPLIAPSAGNPLTQEEFDYHASQQDYTLFLYPSNSYSRTASGAFFDAVSHVKPIIAISNPFFAYYFERFGDIGYLCQDVESVKRTIHAILTEPPGERYDRQKANLLVARTSMSSPELTDLADFWGYFSDMPSTSPCTDDQNKGC